MTKIAAAIDPRTSDGERHIQDVAFLLSPPSTSQPSPAILKRATASNSKRYARRLRTQQMSRGKDAPTQNASRPSSPTRRSSELRVANGELVLQSPATCAPAPDPISTVLPKLRFGGLFPDARADSCDRPIGEGQLELFDFGNACESQALNCVATHHLIDQSRTRPAGGSVNH